MKKSLSAVISLTLICLVTTALLAFVNFFTKPQIEKAEKAATEKALLEVFPDGTAFTEESKADSLPGSVTEVYSEGSGGYIFKLTVTGYSSGMQVLIGIDASGKVTGAKCMASSETLGAEKTYGEIFKGLDSSEADGIATVSGATKTSGAYKKAVGDAFAAFNILKGSGGSHE